MARPWETLPVVQPKDEKSLLGRSPTMLGIEGVVTKKGLGVGRKPRKCQVFPMSGCDLKELTMTELKALYIKEFSKTNTSQLCLFLGTGNVNRRKYF